MKGRHDIRKEPGGCAYPVYGKGHETMDFFYCRASKSWKMRYTEGKRSVLVKMFDRSDSKKADYMAACRMAHKRAIERGMTIQRVEVR